MDNIAFRIVILFVSICMQQIAEAQPFTKKYILSFHSCPIPNCGGPQNHTVYLAESDDAENWTILPNFNGYSGSVPDVITRANKLYIYTPGKVKRYDNSNNQWEVNPMNVSISDSIGNPVQFVDPSAYVDENGNLCLFFLNSTGIVGDPSQCLNPPCTAYFDSAVEVVGSDGTQFVKQSGHRITYTSNSNFIPTDPDIFSKGNLFYIYISYGSGTIVYTSNALHGNYNQIATLPNGYLTNNNAGVPCGLFFGPANLYYSYGHRNTANGSEISMAKHADFTTQANYTSLFTGNSIGLGNVQVASPGICENTFLATSLHETLADTDLAIYPNPNQGSFTLHPKKPMSNISIFDLTGNIIYLYRNTAHNAFFTCNNVPKGMYIVAYSISQKEIHYTKLIVQ